MTPLIAFTLPGLRVHSPNGTHGHWRTKANRVKAERNNVRLFWHLTKGREKLPRPPYGVQLTRIGPRTMDDDNVQGALKHVRDEVAARLGVDDGDESKVSWQYGQLKGPYAVRIEVYRRVSAGRVWAAPDEQNTEAFLADLRVAECNAAIAVAHARLLAPIDDTDPSPPKRRKRK